MKKTILVADDARENLQIMVNLLTEVCPDYSILIAPNGQVACKLAIEKNPELILMDWMMPVMSGIEAVRHLKKQDATKFIPILMVTGQTSSDDLKLALEAGAMDYVRKPIDIVELSARVKSALLSYSYFKQVIVEKDKVEQYAKELEIRNQELRDFTNFASHDLKEPLRKVTFLGEKLEKILGEAIDHNAKDYLGRMRNSFKRMQQLIEDLLKYSKISLDKTPFEKIDLTDVVKEVLSDLEVRINETQGKVEIKNLPVVEADKLQMHQLFQNIIGNALKYHKKEVPPVVVVSSCELSDNYVVISVCDNGIGFDEKYLDRIFKPFQRLHSSSEYEGTGIGTAICDKVVKKHRGNITAQSKIGVGSTFNIVLPVIQNNKAVN